MSEVTLVNVSRRTHVIVLDHPVFRDKKYGFAVTSQPSIEEASNGTRSTRQVRRALPGSITLLPGARITGLHPAIEKVPQVATLLATSPPQVRIEAVPAQPSTT